MLEPGPEYPKAAYRSGSTVEIWGRMMDMRSLIDAQDEKTSLANGWFLHPLEVPEEEEEILIEDNEPKRRGRPPKIRMDSHED